jgi:LacI family transcriptional regulator
MDDQHTKKVSMQNIADAVGVARSTVSFVLNGKEKDGRIGEDVAEKVRKAAKEMNYQFNEVARSLRTGASRAIALVVADISDAFFGTLAYHFQEYAEKKGYVLIIVNTGEKKERLSKIFKTLINRQVDGIIIVPVANIEDNLIEHLNPVIPMVFVDRYFHSFHTSRVIIDNYDVSKMATQILMGKGCKKIALISYRDKLMHMQERKRGYTEALTAAGCYDESLVCEADYFNFKNDIVDFLSDKFTESPKIDGIFIATGGLASVTIRYLANRGISLQSDVHLVGFDRIDTAMGVQIPYVKQPMMEICKNSFDILLNRIQTNENKLVDCKLSASMVTDYF